MTVRLFGVDSTIENIQTANFVIKIGGFFIASKVMDEKIRFLC